MNDPSTPGTLLAATVRLLRTRPVNKTLEQLAKECDCSVAFLSRLHASDPPKRPGVNAIQRLFENLNGKPLFAADQPNPENPVTDEQQLS